MVVLLRQERLQMTQKRAGSFFQRHLHSFSTRGRLTKDVPEEGKELANMLLVATSWEGMLPKQTRLDQTYGSDGKGGRSCPQSLLLLQYLPAVPLRCGIALPSPTEHKAQDKVRYLVLMATSSGKRQVEHMKAVPILVGTCLCSQTECIAGHLG